MQALMNVKDSNREEILRKKSRHSGQRKAVVSGLWAVTFPPVWLLASGAAPTKIVDSSASIICAMLCSIPGWIGWPAAVASSLYVRRPSPAPVCSTAGVRTMHD